MDTQLTVPSSEVKAGEPFDITCTARANPSPEYKFYHDGKLIRWSSTGVLSFASIKSEDQGTYRCVPNNKLGDGPEATVTVTVKGTLERTFFFSLKGRALRRTRKADSCL